jgi:hypothetical protein
MQTDRQTSFVEYRFWYVECKRLNWLIWIIIMVFVIYWFTAIISPLWYQSSLSVGIRWLDNHNINVDHITTIAIIIHRYQIVQMYIMTYRNIWWTCRYLCMFLQRHGYIYIIVTSCYLLIHFPTLYSISTNQIKIYLKLWKLTVSPNIILLGLIVHLDMVDIMLRWIIMSLIITTS